MEKIVLEVPSFHSVTRSYSKKINLSNYVPGRDYESADLFSSHNEQLPVGAKQEEIDALSQKLFEMAQKDVEDTATIIINKLKKAAGMAVELTEKEYEQIKDLTEMLETAVSAEDVEKVVSVIKERKPSLNEGQLDFLRSATSRAKAKTLGDGGTK